MELPSDHLRASSISTSNFLVDPHTGLAKPKDEPNPLLLRELEVVQDEITRFDGNGLRIKEFCITTCAALLAYAAANDKTSVAVAAAVSTGFFSFLELTYRRFQLRFIRRSRRLERLLAENSIARYKYRVHKTAVTSLGYKHELRWVLKLPHFLHFYVGLLVFALGTAWYVSAQKPHTPVPNLISVSGSVTNYSGGTKPTTPIP